MANVASPAQFKRLVGYFPSWGIHAQNYHVPDVPAGQLSHVIYAFANVTAAGDCVSVSPDDDKINFPQPRIANTSKPTTTQIGRQPDNALRFAEAIAVPGLARGVTAQSTQRSVVI